MRRFKGEQIRLDLIKERVLRLEGREGEERVHVHSRSYNSYRVWFVIAPCVRRRKQEVMVILRTITVYLDRHLGRSVIFKDDMEGKEGKK